MESETERTTENRKIAELERRMQALLNTDTAVTLGVLSSFAGDYDYREYLKMCRATPSYLKHLLEHPTLPGNEADLMRAGEILGQWETRFRYEEKRKAYDRKYRTFLKAKKSKDCGSLKYEATEDFQEVYLDNSATTMVRPEIARWLADFYQGAESDANPSSDYVQGMYAKSLIEEARGAIAEILHTHSRNIVFTSSGSEADNLAIKGIAFAHLKDKGHLVTSSIEHPAVLETMRYLETLGFEVSYIRPDKEGRISAEAVERSIRSDTLLVSVMTANNEIGTVNPIAEIGALCRQRQIPFMSDGVQAFGKMDINPEAMGISLFSFSGHKIYGPKGAGGLYIAPGITLVPQIHGGGQENGIRSSTENTAAIAALGKAAAISMRELEVEKKRIESLRDYFLKELIREDTPILVYGSMKERIYSNLCLGFYRVNGQALKNNLNRAGICVSTGSACSTRKTGPSYVLTEIGADVENYGMIRMGLGISTTKEQLDYVLMNLRKLLPSLIR